MDRNKPVQTPYHWWGSPNSIYFHLRFGFSVWIPITEDTPENNPYPSTINIRLEFATMRKDRFVGIKLGVLMLLNKGFEADWENGVLMKKPEFIKI